MRGFLATLICGLCALIVIIWCQSIYDLIPLEQAQALVLGLTIPLGLLKIALLLKL